MWRAAPGLLRRVRLSVGRETVTRKKQVRALIDALEEHIAWWERQCEKFAEGEIDAIPSLGERVQDQLHSLRGYDKDTAAKYEWALSY